MLDIGWAHIWYSSRGVLSKLDMPPSSCFKTRDVKNIVLVVVNMTNFEKQDMCL